jgi:hypothetical protein
MGRTTGLFLTIMVFINTGYGQMVQRAPVGFAAYYYEAPWTNTHAIVELSCGSPDQEESIEVWYETVDGTAKAGEHYTATKGSHLFYGGSPTRRIAIEIPILKQLLQEDKTFRIRVTRADFPGEVSQSSGEVPVTIAGLPRLTIYQYQTNLFFHWRAGATNFTLEARPTFDSEYWRPVSGELRRTRFDPGQTLVVPFPNQPSFFRLRAAH